MHFFIIYPYSLVKKAETYDRLLKIDTLLRSHRSQIKVLQRPRNEGLYGAVLMGTYTTSRKELSLHTFLLTKDGFFLLVCILPSR